MADASRAVLRYVEESSWGVTPSSALTEVRITGESLKTDTDFQTTSEISSDREVTGVVRTGASMSGGFDFELSYGNLDDFLEGALSNDWSLDDPSSGTDTLTNGTTTKSYTIEKEFDDQTIYLAYTGCRVNSLSLNFQPGEIITGSLGFMGKVGTSATSTVGTGAATAAPTNDQLNAVEDITTFNEASGSLSGVSSFSIDLQNNLRMQPEIGTLGPRGIGYGRIVVTGSLEVYFESRTLYDKYLNWTTTDFEVAVTDGSNTYTITIPEVKFTDGQVLAGGNDSDVFASLDWHAFKDSGTSNTIKIARS